MSRPHVALLLLSFSAGAADAFAFLALGGIFTANMTGNLILTGMFTRAQYPTTLLTAVIALVCFMGVLFAAFRIVATRPNIKTQPAQVIRRVIMPSTAVQTIVVIIWIVAPGTSGLIERCAIIALSASGLALQTVGAKTISDVDGITTTYVTGTLTTTMQDLADGEKQGQQTRVLSVLALPFGAVCETALLASRADLGPVVPWLTAVAATIVLWKGETNHLRPSPGAGTGTG